MNKEYIYIDGKAIIKDENGNQKPIEYYDNLDEVLVQENFIETMENEINELKRKKERINIEKARFIPFMTCLVLVMIIFGIPPIQSLLAGKEAFDLMIDTIFGQISQLQIMQISIGLSFIPYAICYDCHEYKLKKDVLKEKNGITSELEVLEEMIIVSKEKLEALKKEKTKNNENNEFRVVKLNDKDKLKSLRNCLVLFYDLGYNSEKYYEYYEQGKLEKKLGKHYCDYEIEAAKEYFEEKGPVLSKKKGHNKGHNNE